MTHRHPLPEHVPAELRFTATMGPRSTHALVARPAWPFLGTSFGLPRDDHQHVDDTLELLLTSVRCGNIELLVGGDTELATFLHAGIRVDFPAMHPAQCLAIGCANPTDRELTVDFVVRGYRPKLPGEGPS